jgi:acetate kinase
MKILVAILVIPTNEELKIARETRNVVASLP